MRWKREMEMLRLEHLQLLLIGAVLILSPGYSKAKLQCPRICECGYELDSKNDTVLTTSCFKGGLRNIPTAAMDRETLVVKIIAPSNDTNNFTLGPVFTQQKPFLLLEELYIINSNIPAIGQHSFWGLQFLRVLNLTHNKITAIDADNFRGLINLTDLHLDHNDIEAMPSETFKHLTALTTLTISDNNITTLMPRVFRMLAMLEHLDLSGNPLDDLPPEIFKDIQHLKVFICRRCQIPRMNTQIYHLLPRLEELDLGDNDFKYLNSDEFHYLRNLKILRLDGNHFPVIVDFTFVNQAKLTTLSLARNRLALLAPLALANLTSLVELDISENRINKFYPGNFNAFKNTLKTIDFSGNKVSLTEISKALQSMPEIIKIGLANLSITSLDTYFFSNNQNIQSLDVSGNEMSEFPAKVMIRMRFLQHFDISHNKLKTLDEISLDRLEAIANISINDNAWDCTQCSAATMIAYMSTTVLNETLRNLKCSTPLLLKGRYFKTLDYEKLGKCGRKDESQLVLIASSMILTVTVLGSITTAVCISHRHRAIYNTCEGKRLRVCSCEQQPEEIELQTVTTLS